MTMLYELWDTESGNCLGEFETEQAALALVRRSAQSHGQQALQCPLLLGEDGTGLGEPRTIAEGAELLARALAHVAA